MKTKMKKWWYPALVWIINVGILLGFLTACGGNLKPIPAGLYYDPAHPGHVIMTIIQYEQLIKHSAYMEGRMHGSPYKVGQ